MTCIVKYCQYFVPIIIFKSILSIFFANCNVKKIYVMLQLSISIHFSEKCDCKFPPGELRAGSKRSKSIPRNLLHDPMARSNSLKGFLRDTSSCRELCVTVMNNCDNRTNWQNHLFYILHPCCSVIAHDSGHLWW